MQTKSRSAVIVGVGPSTGEALSHALSVDHKLALVARSTERITRLSKTLANASAFACDVSDQSNWRKTLDGIEREIGLPGAVILNTEGGGLGTYDKIDPEAFDGSFSATTTSLLTLAQTWFPKAVDHDHDMRVLITTSPAAWEPKPVYTGLAPARVAQKCLAEMLRDTVADSKIEIGMLAIDGAIDEPRMRAFFPDRGDDSFITPNAIANRIKALLEAPELEFRSDIRAKHHLGI